MPDLLKWRNYLITFNYEAKQADTHMHTLETEFLREKLWVYNSL